MKRVIALFSTVIFLMQSCVVYQKVPVALENAVEKGEVKVLTTSNETMKFREILLVSDSLYVGVISNSKTLDLNEELIRRVYLKNDTSSGLASIGLGFLIILASFALYGMIVMLSYYGQ